MSYLNHVLFIPSDDRMLRSSDTDELLGSRPPLVAAWRSALAPGHWSAVDEGGDSKNAWKPVPAGDPVLEQEICAIALAFNRKLVPAGIYHMALMLAYQIMLVTRIRACRIRL
jgi:hypothetical protein